MTNPGPVPAVNQYAIVEEPPWPPKQQALYAAALLIDEPSYRPSWTQGITYPTDRCGNANVWPAGCGTAPALQVKAMYSPTWVTGRPALLYAGYTCRPGADPDEGRRSAIAQLEYFEESTVENLFWSGNPDMGIPGWLIDDPNVLDMTAGNDPNNSYGSLPFVDALGRLESVIRRQMGGRGIIHAPAWMAAYYANRHAIRDGRPSYQTWNGNRWVFGNYTGQGPAADPFGANNWLFATGAIVIRRGPVFTRDVFDPVKNTQMWLAERLIVISVECQILAINIDLSREQGPPLRSGTQQQQQRGVDGQ